MTTEYLTSGQELSRTYRNLALPTGWRITLQVLPLIVIVGVGIILVNALLTHDTAGDIVIILTFDILGILYLWLQQPDPVSFQYGPKGVRLKVEVFLHSRTYELGWNRVVSVTPVMRGEMMQYSIMIAFNPIIYTQKQTGGIRKIRSDVRRIEVNEQLFESMLSYLPRSVIASLPSHEA